MTSIESARGRTITDIERTETEVRIVLDNGRVLSMEADLFEEVHFGPQVQTHPSLNVTYDGRAV